ncbi:MAG: glycyl-radical enzyme activating protein [Bacteroidales bacterium]|jgi:pyruvate formate lyase activating enzyme
MTDGYLFDIQGFSVHDGPGCRTLIFLKGCSLRCNWCSNPEGIQSLPEPLYNSSKCIFDKLCLVDCTKQAITADDHELHFNKELCSECIDYECSAACCTGALKIGGYKITIEDLMKIVQRDRQYWGSTGGITLTGGEPFIQPEFAHALLQRCHQSFIHTAVETCGNIPWRNLEPSLEYTDWILFDLKHMDDKSHLQMTGAGNKLILENARRLAAKYKGRLVFRMPVIPGFNDNDKNIKQLANFMNSIRKDEINILPLHHLGREKYKLLGREYYTEDFTITSKESFLQIKSVLNGYGIKCYPGTETPF